MILTQNQIDELSDIADRALQQLFRDDLSLIQRRGMERSIVFRFGIYFHQLTRNIEWINNLDLDLEYNKNGDNVKATIRRPRGVQPDFILHRRGNNDYNTLIIEFKGWWNSHPRARELDRQKIEDFVNQEGEYKYGLGLLVEIEMDTHRVEIIKDYEIEVEEN